MSAIRLIRYLWLAVAALWLLTGFSTKPDVRRADIGTRLIELAGTVIGGFLLFAPGLGVGFLGWRFVPPEEAFEWIGLALTAAGIGFTAMARLYLGRNWSGRVTIKEHHELIRGGPYRIVRHPIYSGLLLAALGTAVAVGEVRGLLGFLLATLGWWSKLRVEERFLTEQFGDDYTRYRRKVRGALIPFLL